jgi:hypothetical protein
VTGVVSQVLAGAIGLVVIGAAAGHMLDGLRWRLACRKYTPILVLVAVFAMACHLLGW